MVFPFAARAPRALAPLALAALAPLAVGCDDDDSPAAAEPQAVSVRFAAKLGDTPAACGVRVEGVGATQGAVTVKDLRFYVSEVALLTDAGEAVPLALEARSPWQSEAVALLDFEDGTGPCADSGNAELNDVVTGTVPAGTYTGVQFTLGVPAGLNHLDTAAAPSPLNLGSMFWAWSTGYKFVRVDLLNDNPAPANGWFVHLGSTFCDSPAPTTAPTSPCGHPNRPTIALSGFDAATQTVVFDVAALLAEADVTVNTPDTSPGCMSAANDATECGPVFAGFGLDFETGDCVNGCAGQRAFRVE